VTTDADKELILIVEDEALIRLSLAARLRDEGYEVVEAETGAEGIAALESKRVDLVLLDFRLPDLDGLEVLERIAPRYPGLVTIMMTAYGTIEGVVRAMRAGAYTYVRKPFELDEIVEHVRRGLETTQLRREVERLRREAAGSAEVKLVGRSPWLREVEGVIERLNEVGTSSVLILGESGTGKSLLARRLHATSARAKAPLMTITCTDFSDQLLESELFGHEKGAFTGADRTKRGLIELAEGGTVFLDEIGDMPLSLQAKLLRFLEERRFRRVGGTREIAVDVRIVAATNRDLESRMEAGEFRRDLYYRLAVVPLEIPPLRERPEDIEDLVHLFVADFAEAFHREVQRVEPEVIAQLQAQPWPGNVRELRNVIERGVILGRQGQLELGNLAQGEGAIGGNSPPQLAERILGSEGIQLEELEQALVRRALDLSQGNRSAAARLLGMSRDQMRYRIEKFGLNED
jgi:two-component system, NtrC family, response regulator AtoC